MKELILLLFSVLIRHALEFLILFPKNTDVRENGAKGDNESEGTGASSLSGSRKNPGSQEGKSQSIPVMYYRILAKPIWLSGSGDGISPEETVG